MNTESRKLFNDVLKLSASERADLAARLIQSIDPEVDQEIDAAWGEEVKRRNDELDSGAVAAIPWPEARRLIMEPRGMATTN